MAGDAIRTGPQGWPERTIFSVIEPWTYKWLRQPDGPEAGDPWHFTEEQRRFMAWWYAYDERGRWVYRRGVLRRVKGWGKDPVGAVIAAVEMLGPCRIYPKNGGLVVKPNPSGWVQVAAVSRDQTRTTMSLFPALFSKAAIEHFKIDLNKEIIYARTGTVRIEAITSSPTSAEGPRATFVLENEIQNWWSNNDGHAMYGVIQGNLTKSRDGAARQLGMCNAHVPGRDSIGEREWDTYQKIKQGRSRATGVLYDSLEAPADTDLADEASLRRGLELARGDSHWLDIDRHVEEIYDPQTPPSESRRKYLNQIIAAEDAWASPQDVDQLLEPAPRPLQRDDMVALAWDGSKSDDHSALTAVRIDDGASFAIGVWDPKEHGGLIPRDQVDGSVEWSFERFDVVAFYGDLEGWESYLDRWADAHGSTLCVHATAKHPIAWDMRGHQKEFTLEGAHRIQNEIAEHAFRIGHVEDAPRDDMLRLVEHIKNARRRPNNWGVTFAKENRESAHKVDGLASLTLGRMARRAYLALPPNRQRQKKSGRAVFF